MPEEKNGPSPEPQQPESPPAADPIQPEGTPADLPPNDAPTEDAPPKQKDSTVLLPVLCVLLAFVFVFELALVAFIGLKVYQNNQLNEEIAERRAAVQASNQSGSGSYSYIGRGWKIVDGVRVETPESRTSGSSAPSLDTQPDNAEPEA